MNLKLHLVLPFTTLASRSRFQEYDVILHSQTVLPVFSVPGTMFQGKTATYFDHKIPCKVSTIECIENGDLSSGEKSDIHFVNPITPPYKNNK